MPLDGGRAGDHRVAQPRGHLGLAQALGVGAQIGERERIGRAQALGQRMEAAGVGELLDALLGSDGEVVAADGADAQHGAQLVLAVVRLADRAGVRMRALRGQAAARAQAPRAPPRPGCLRAPRGWPPARLLAPVAAAGPMRTLVDLACIRPRPLGSSRMPARVNFTDAGVAFDADGALAPAAQLVAKLRLAIDAGAIPEGATLPSIRDGRRRARRALRTRCARCTPRSRRRATRRRATARAPSRTCSDAAGAAAVRAHRRTAHSRARAATGADAQLVAMAILAGAGGGSRHSRAARPPRDPSRSAQARAARARRRRAPGTLAPVLPPDVMRGSHVGLVTGDAALVARARDEAAAARRAPAGGRAGRRADAR